VLLHGFDYVSPLYLRHKYDGTITNSIVYPLTRALYGQDAPAHRRRLRLLGAPCAHYLQRPVWETNVARFGIDIWMTTTALADSFRVCESFLGQDPRRQGPGADLQAMMVQWSPRSSTHGDLRPALSRGERGREVRSSGFPAWG
jgi:hypothetical protein